MDRSLLDMAALSPHVQPLAIFTGFICSLQSLAWGVLSLLALIGHGECDLWDKNSVFLSALQMIYYQDRKCPSNIVTTYEWQDDIMDSSAILAWMIIMLSINSIWLIASLSFVVAWDRKISRFTLPLTAVWCFVTACVCTMDLTACAMFGADYGAILSVNKLSDAILLAPSAVMMTLSIRGFVLWVFNIGMLFYFLANLPTVQRHANALKSATTDTTALDLYGPPAPGYDAFNEGYVRDNDQNRERSSAATSLAAGYPRRAPGQHIPRPDYSPPMDAKRPKPGLRSALKNKY